MLNEPIRQYAPGSAERGSLESKLKEIGETSFDLTSTIDGVEQLGGGDRIAVVQPHRHAALLGTAAESEASQWGLAIEAALRAAPAWRDLAYEDRAAILLKAADLLAGPWRDTLNAATMLGQSKTAFQAEIDSACELIDFLRFNVAFGHRVHEEQPISSPGVWNRMDHRPLEGFVLAITPFNFTAIAG
ncbi:MAG: 1-pyrroline-5-carboxylate dehydrogenase, partial [Frankiales bacterium]|nr:1-pyrroline-5-carboxylate dehydrogenase [Frankiales bacterium]